MFLYDHQKAGPKFKLICLPLTWFLEAQCKPTRCTEKIYRENSWVTKFSITTFNFTLTAFPAFLFWKNWCICSGGLLVFSLLVSWFCCDQTYLLFWRTWSAGKSTVVVKKSGWWEMAKPLKNSVAYKLVLQFRVKTGCSVLYAGRWPNMTKYSLVAIFQLYSTEPLPMQTTAIPTSLHLPSDTGKIMARKQWHLVSRSLCLASALNR